MANYTPIVKLLKPLETDKYDVNLRNDNWQKIDDFFGKLQSDVKRLFRQTCWGYNERQLDL